MENPSSSKIIRYDSICCNNSLTKVTLTTNGTLLIQKELIN